MRSLDTPSSEVVGTDLNIPQPISEHELIKNLTHALELLSQELSELSRHTQSIVVALKHYGVEGVVVGGVGSLGSLGSLGSPLGSPLNSPLGSLSSLGSLGSLLKGVGGLQRPLPQTPPPTPR